MLEMEPIHGIVVATLNPYSLNQSGQLIIDTSNIVQYADYLRSNGTTSVFVCGTTGDFSVLSCEERLQVQEAWLAAEVRAKFDHVIVQIGSSVWADMIRLGEHASGRGASAVAVTLPSFKHHAPQSANQVIQYLDRVSHALPDMPLLVYNIEGATPPHLVNNWYPIMKEALENNKIPTLVGLKYTSPFHLDAFEILTKLPLQVCLGCDELVFPSFASGFKVFIGSTFNVFSSKCSEVLALADSGKVKEAQKLHSRLFDAIRLLGSKGAFMLNLRTVTNRVLQKRNFSIGYQTKFDYITSEDIQIAGELTDAVLNNFSDLLNN